MAIEDDRARSFDVAVVGAGPAGSMAALGLARAGVRVALIDRERWPRYKTCGGGVVARAFGILPAGLAIPVEHECPAVEAHFLDSDLHFRVERDAPVVSMTMRADLDASMAGAAVAAGAETLSPCTVLDLRQDRDGVDLETSLGRIRARWVVGADGVLSTVARKAGWTEPLATIPALESEVRVSAAVHARFAGTARFDFEATKAGYGWVFPKREHLSCGILTMERGSGGLHAALDRYLDRVGLGERIGETRHGHLIPVRPRSALVRGRVLLAGDAAGLADPLTGEGISIALRSGQLVAAALLDARLGPGTEHSLRRGMRRSGLWTELRISRALAAVVYRRPRLARSIFERRGVAICEAVTDVFVGRTSFTSLLVRPAGYFRLLRPTRRVTSAAGERSG